MPQDDQLPIVLQLARSEKNPDPECILLHVSSHGTKPLDLKLVATDSESVFVVSFKQNKTSSWKAPNSKQSQVEWETILSSLFLDDSPEDAGNLLEGVEAVSEIIEKKNNKSLHITIQKRIEGITQRLGQIILEDATEDEEISLHEWCSLAIKSRTLVKTQAQKTKSNYAAKDEEIVRLEAALAELTKLKNDNENTLLEKFSLLLNEKKLKIRDQQKLLATATVDQSKVEGMELETEEPTRASRAKKRKAKAQKVVESDSDDAFQKMDVDAPGAKAQESEEDVSDQVDQQTASETESDSDVPAPSRTAPRTSSPPIKKSQVSQERLSQVKESSPPSRRTRAHTAEVEPVPTKEIKLPPRRELPFAQKPPPKKTSPPPAAIDGSETESDDEL